MENPNEIEPSSFGFNASLAEEFTDAVIDQMSKALDGGVQMGRDEGERSGSIDVNVLNTGPSHVKQSAPRPSPIEETPGDYDSFIYESNNTLPPPRTPKKRKASRSKSRARPKSKSGARSKSRPRTMSLSKTTARKGPLAASTPVGSMIDTSLPRIIRLSSRSTVKPAPRVAPKKRKTSKSRVRKVSMKPKVMKRKNAVNRRKVKKLHWSPISLSIFDFSLKFQFFPFISPI